MPRAIASSPTRDVGTARRGQRGDGIYPPVVNPSCPTGSLLIFLEATYHTTLPCVPRCSGALLELGQLAPLVCVSLSLSVSYEWCAGLLGDGLARPSLSLSLCVCVCLCLCPCLCGLTRAGGPIDSGLGVLSFTATRRGTSTTALSSTLLRSPRGARRRRRLAAITVPGSLSGTCVWTPFNLLMQGGGAVGGAAGSAGAAGHPTPRDRQRYRPPHRSARRHADHLSAYLVRAAGNRTNRA